MKRTIVAATMVVLMCGVSLGQDRKQPAPAHLKIFNPMIGSWRYQGPLLEDVPEVAKKGSDYVFQLSWKWILGKNAIEENWLVEYEGGERITGKSLIGWNAAEKRIASCGVDSTGGMGAGTITPNPAAKTMPLTASGIDGHGKETSFTGVVTIVDKNTITWQGLDRVGGMVPGDSPVYLMKRVVKPAASRAR